MNKILKKILLMGLLLLPMMVGYTNVQANVGIAPEFEEDFANYFKGSDSDTPVYTIQGVSSKKTLKENIHCIFYPNNYAIAGLDCGSTAGYGGSIWNIMRYLGYALLVLFIVIAGIKLLINGSSAEKVKPALSSILYIILGALLFFGSVWILGSVLKIGTLNGTTGLADNIHKDEGSLLFFVLSFAKALAFIAAIVMMVVHGFKMMSSADKSDKVKIGLKGLLNVIVALIIIKLIDYVYYIAQLSDLVTEATTLIIEIAKVLGFIIGALMVIMLFYAGFLFITDQGSSEKMKKAKNIIIGIVVTALVIFSLLLIIYEVFNEFA